VNRCASQLHVRTKHQTEHTNPLLIGQAQIEHLTAGRSSTLCQLAQRYSIQLIREALLSQADTIGSIQGWCLPKESVKPLSS
jgi:hypothetical protein